MPRASRSLVRSLWTRHCFDDDSFTTRDIGAGLMVKTIGGSNVSHSAEALIKWLESGVFQALYDGYLEKVILIMSADEAAEDVLEAWSLSVSWTMGEDGVEQPSIALSANNKTEKSIGVKAKSKYTTGYVRKLSQVMMRELCAMLHVMPELPTLHWLSSTRPTQSPPAQSPRPRPLVTLQRPAVLTMVRVGTHGCRQCACSTARV